MNMCFFDANSFALSGDTLFLQERVQIESWDFTGSNDFFTVAGISDTIEVRDELTGSSFVQWDWDGAIKMTSNALSSLFSNGGQWNSDFVKTGTGSLILVDDFINKDQKPFN